MMIKNTLLSKSKFLFYYLAEMSFNKKNGDYFESQHKLIDILDAIKLSFKSSEQSIGDSDIIHYLLCTVADEHLFENTKGYSPNSKSLASKYHKDTNGGVKFFHFLNEWMLDVDKYVENLEICYVCLITGFKGRYSIIKEGKTELDKKIKQLHYLLKDKRNYQRMNLITLNRSKAKKVRLVKFVKAFCLSAFLIIGSYGTYSIFLNSKIDNLAQEVNNIISQGFV